MSGDILFSSKKFILLKLIGVLGSFKEFHLGCLIVFEINGEGKKYSNWLSKGDILILFLIIDLILPICVTWSLIKAHWPTNSIVWRRWVLEKRGLTNQYMLTSGFIRLVGSGLLNISDDGEFCKSFISLSTLGFLSSWSDSIFMWLQ